MLEKVNLKKITIKEEFKLQVKDLELKLSTIQQDIKKANIPVVILFEGMGTSGKGSLISKLILNLDPRGFKVFSMSPPSSDELRKPFLWRYWTKIPENGNISIFDRSWYEDISVYAMENKLSKKEVESKTESINILERQLTDGGYLVIKFFLHIDKKEQKKRIEKLASTKSTAWRIKDIDRRRNKHYEDYYDCFDKTLENTNTPYAPWHMIASHDKNSAIIDIYTTILDTINQKIEKNKEEAIINPIITSPKFPTVIVPKLSEINLNKVIEKDDYDKILEEEQDKLKKLHNKIYLSKTPVIIAYEGWDAAGKGGNIKRVAQALDPCGYEVIPVASPSKVELNHHYLWRFWNNIPKDGHIAIFDRTWYGRVMVERIEGFCSTDDWHRAFNEINEFEKELHNWGAIILKFWIHIDKDEQLRRFTDRQNTPEKQWKITDEDWRNRDKWDLYEESVNDMLQYTSTDFAPWTIIESQDKKFARIKALKTIVQTIEDSL